MKKQAVWIAVLLLAGAVLSLSACKGSTPPPAPTARPTATPTAASEAEPPTADEELPSEPDADTPLLISTPTTPGQCEASPLPTLSPRPVDKSDWVKGNPDGSVTLYEYSDFQCPGCAGMHTILDMFLADHPDVRLVYRHFPLSFHPYAEITAAAADPPGAQGKFWEMHDMIFDRRGEWIQLPSEADVRAKLVSYAGELGLDTERFERELKEGVYLDKIEAQGQEAMDLGLPGTPSFIFDNVLFPSDIGLSYYGLASFLDFLQKQEEVFFDEPPEMSIDPEGKYEATLTTSKGEMVVELFPQSAPVHVNNFVFLANNHWYDGSDFFFVQDNFVAVTGDPTNSTIGYPGYYCTGEDQGVFDRSGLLGMLSNGQFFITLGTDASRLSGQFALIGRVVKGQDVLDTLARRAVGDPAEADVLKSVKVVELSK